MKALRKNVPSQHHDFQKRLAPRSSLKGDLQQVLPSARQYTKLEKTGDGGRSPFSGTVFLEAQQLRGTFLLYLQYIGGITASNFTRGPGPVNNLAKTRQRRGNQLEENTKNNADIKTDDQPPYGGQKRDPKSRRPRWNDHVCTEAATREAVFPRAA